LLEDREDGRHVACFFEGELQRQKLEAAV
jgi:hypothetical protein